MATSGIDALHRQLQIWGLFARILIGVYLAIVALLIVAFGFYLWREIAMGYSFFLVSQPGAALWLAVGFLLSAIPVSIWIYRAHDHLREIGLSGLNYRPSWAVGSFFVPVINLVAPMRAMRELWNRSHGEEAHFAHISAGDITNWWTCLLVGAALQAYLDTIVVMAQVMHIHVTTPPGVNTALALFSLVLLGGSAVILWRIITAITAAQKSVTGIGDTFA